MEELIIKGKKAKAASLKLAVLSTAKKNQVLLKIADALGVLPGELFKKGDE